MILDALLCAIVLGYWVVALSAAAFLFLLIYCFRR